MYRLDFALSGSADKERTQRGHQWEIQQLKPFLKLSSMLVEQTNNIFQ